MDEDDWLMALRFFFVPLDTKWVISETFLPACGLVRGTLKMDEDERMAGVR